MTRGKREMAVPVALRPALPRSARQPASLASSLLEWFTANARDLPWRRTRDPYAIWVSEIMLQQTQVKTVIPYFERWMRELPTITALASASSEKVHKLWEGLGYYTRVRNMQRAAQRIVSEHGGKFPAKFDDVFSLPGIGRYTAGAICSIAFNATTPILDGNVIRVLTRVFGIRENAREKETNAALWSLAQQLVSAAAEIPMRVGRTHFDNCSALNQSLMELGALVCTPKSPQCNACPLRRECIARKQNCTETLPNLGARVAVTPRWFAAVVVTKNGRTIVRQRPEGVVNAHLWEFPNVEVPLKSSAKFFRAAVETELGCATEQLIALGTIHHTITRYRISLEVFRAELNGTVPRHECGLWKTSHEIAQLPFTSAHGRIAKKWLGVATGDS